MLRGRVGGTGEAFNLGEATATRLAVISVALSLIALVASAYVCVIG